MAKVERVCEMCKTSFFVFPCKIKKHGMSRFCSRKCADLFQVKKVEVKCRNCNKDFLSQPARFKYSRGLFCSKKCAYEWNKGPNNIKYREKVEKVCQICGNVFKIFQSVDSKGKGKFCSQKCLGVWNSVNRRGDKSPTWKNPKDRKTPVSMQARRTFEYVLWRKSVFARDNFTCQGCNSRGGVLNAHHILPFVLFPDKRTEISNGITLCVKCHKKQHFHKYKARR